MAASPSVVRRRGMVSGAGFFGVFGALWLFAGVTFFENPQLIWHLAVPLILGAAVLVWQSRVRHRLAREPSPDVSPDDAARDARILRWFIIINIAQYAAIAAAVWLCIRQQRLNDIVPAISVIVGFHFAALSPVFRTPFHLAVGIVMCLWVAAVLAAIEATGVPPVLASAPSATSALIAFGNGVLLFFCAAWYLLRAQQGSPAAAGA